MADVGLCHHKHPDFVCRSESVSESISNPKVDDHVSQVRLTVSGSKSQQDRHGATLGHSLSKSLTHEAWNRTAFPKM